MIHTNFGANQMYGVGGDKIQNGGMRNLWNVQIKKKKRQSQCAHEIFSILEYGKAPKKAFDVAE